MKITWLGHASFLLDADGYQLVLDPYEDGYVPGLSNIREEADLVLCSHEHNDHNARQVVALKEGGISPLTITEIDTWHDEVQGAKRGSNKIFILDDGKEKIAHLGDLGCELEEEQMAKLMNLDAVMVPVGGFFTIDAGQAADLVKKLNPKKIYPMHYRDDELGFGYEIIGTVKQFTDLLPEWADRMVVTVPKYAK